MAIHKKLSYKIILLTLIFLFIGKFAFNFLIQELYLKDYFLLSKNEKYLTHINFFINIPLVFLFKYFFKILSVNFQHSFYSKIIKNLYNFSKLYYFNIIYYIQYLSLPTEDVFSEEGLIWVHTPGLTILESLFYILFCIFFIFHFFYCLAKKSFGKSKEKDGAIITYICLVVFATLAFLLKNAI